MRNRIWVLVDAGSGSGIWDKIRIRDKHPGSATLINMSSFSFYRDFLYYFLFQSNEGELEDLADLQDTVKI